MEARTPPVRATSSRPMVSRRDRLPPIDVDASEYKQHHVRVGTSGFIPGCVVPRILGAEAC